jgi:hypothetical protein
MLCSTVTYLGNVVEYGRSEASSTGSFLYLGVEWLVLASVSPGFLAATGGVYVPGWIMLGWLAGVILSPDASP